MAKTYEMHMFKTASKKLGLDQAILSGSRPRKAQDKAGPTAKEVSEKKTPSGDINMTCRLCIVNRDSN